MKTIKKSELTKFFKIVADNELSTRAKMEAYIREKQTQAVNMDVFSDEAIALRNEVELLLACHNYLSDVMKNSSVISFLNEYSKK
jgi:hypothetical protein